MTVDDALDLATVDQLRAALLRRGQQPPILAPAVLDAPGWRLDVHGRTILRAGREIRVSGRERDVFAVLIAARGGWVPRAAVATAVWGSSDLCTLRAVQTYLSCLRGRLGEGSIESAKGNGGTGPGALRLVCEPCDVGTAS